jgi:hypothetical protein
MNSWERAEQFIRDRWDDIRWYSVPLTAGFFFGAGVIGAYLVYKWVMVCP